MDREKIHEIVSKGCRMCDYWDAENYHCMLNVPIHPAYPCHITDQLSALLPNEEEIIQARKEQMVIDWVQAGKDLEEAKREERERIANHLTKIIRVNISGNGIRSELGKYAQTLKEGK